MLLTDNFSEISILQSHGSSREANLGMASSSGNIESGLKEHLITLAVLGDQAVGKTSLVLRFTNNNFNPKEQTTIGLDYKEFPYAGSDSYTIRLYDTAGQERFRAITASFLKRVEGIALVFDLSQQDSFNNLRAWLRFVRDQKTAVPFFGEPRTPSMGSIVLIGNKADLVSAEQLQRIKEVLEDEDGLSIYPFFTASALKGEGVLEPFQQLIDSCIQRRAALKDGPSPPEPRPSITLPTHRASSGSIHQDEEEPRSTCCR